MVTSAIAMTKLVLAVGVGMSALVAPSNNQGIHDSDVSALAINSCQSVGGTSLKASGIPFGNSMNIKISLQHHPVLIVRATCREGRGGGWAINANEPGHTLTTFISSELSYWSPVAILGLYNYSPTSMPAIVAQVGLGMTGQPLELLTFKGQSIVPAKMTFPSYGLNGLFYGGAAAHGQGVVCSRHQNRFQLTQLFWSGPSAGAPTVTVSGGGQEFAPGDTVSIHSIRWTFQGQPLRQASVQKLATTPSTYARAGLIDNENCSG